MLLVLLLTLKANAQTFTITITSDNYGGDHPELGPIYLIDTDAYDNDCSKLEGKKVVINNPNNYYYVIEEMAFKECHFSSITFAPGLLAIGVGAFAGSRGLSSVIIPEGCFEIGDQAFWMSDLSSIELPESIERIGNFAFKDCYSLRTITFKTMLPPGSALGTFDTGINDAFCKHLHADKIKVIIPNGANKVYWHFTLYSFGVLLIPEENVIYADE